MKKQKGVWVSLDGTIEVLEKDWKEIQLFLLKHEISHSVRRIDMYVK